MNNGSPIGPGRNSHKKINSQEHHYREGPRSKECMQPVPGSHVSSAQLKRQNPRWEPRAAVPILQWHLWRPWLWDPEAIWVELRWRDRIQGGTQRCKIYFVVVLVGTVVWVPEATSVALRWRDKIWSQDPEQWTLFKTIAVGAQPFQRYLAEEIEPKTKPVESGS